MYLRLSPYREILQGVLTDLEVNEGIIKITGKSGAGKTALCSQLYQELERKGQSAIFFLTPPASATALQNSILDSLKLGTSGNFTKTLTVWLLANIKERKPLVLIFDDAQHLDLQALGAIRMLCNIQDASRALIRVIVCGTEALDQKFATTALRAVTQFLSQSATLPYLSLEQMEDFCQGYWLRTAQDMKPMSQKILLKLFQETQGHPGILQARLSQGTTGAEKLDSTDDNEAGTRTRPGRYPGQRPGWIPAILTMAGLILLGSTGGYLFLLQDSKADLTTAVVIVEELPAPAATPETEVVERGITEIVATETLVQESEIPVAEVTETEAIEATQAIVAEALPAASEPEAVAMAELPQIETFIAAWTNSWQSRDVDAYLGHYHPEFVPAQDVALSEWQNQRRRVISNVGNITITVEPVEYTVDLQEGQRSVRFWLHYSANNYADRTLKELLLVPVNGNWRILTETNMRTERE